MADIVVCTLQSNQKVLTGKKMSVIIQKSNGNNNTQIVEDIEVTYVSDKNGNFYPKVSKPKTEDSFSSFTESDFNELYETELRRLLALGIVFIAVAPLLTSISLPMLSTNNTITYTFIATEAAFGVFFLVKLYLRKKKIDHMRNVLF